MAGERVACLARVSRKMAAALDFGCGAGRGEGEDLPGGILSERRKPAELRNQGRGEVAGVMSVLTNIRGRPEAGST
jgi:hypothetical protein